MHAISVGAPKAWGTTYVTNASKRMRQACKSTAVSAEFASCSNERVGRIVPIVRCANTRISLSDQPGCARIWGAKESTFTGEPLDDMSDSGNIHEVATASSRSQRNAPSTSRGSTRPAVASSSSWKSASFSTRASRGNEMLARRKSTSC